jgi:hypothetical protein
VKRVAKIIFFNPWGDGFEPIEAYLSRLPSWDITPRLAAGADARLRKMAHLDCDWHGECARCFSSLAHPQLRFNPAWITGISGLAEVAQHCAKPADEIRWLVFIAQHPQSLEPALVPFCSFLKKQGVRIALYAYDEASRSMPCFGALAPLLDVLIHDELPLGPAASGLRPDCINRHRSWVANVLPFTVPFNEHAERKIIFLGSQLGLTPHRHRQIDFLKTTFKDRFLAFHDHSVSVAARDGLSCYTVGFCPEGRKFNTPSMARSHTDRPFWSGCLGLVPVAENSTAGGRLDELAEAGLIRRYAHADLKSLRDACAQALDATPAERRAIYDYFNRHETVGTVLADAMAAAMLRF